MARVQAYSRHVAELLDAANGDAESAAARRACEVALEYFAIALAKAGRLYVNYQGSCHMSASFPLSSLLTL